MTSLNRKAVYVLVLLFFPGILTAFTERQHEWSGGGGVLGPVTYWGNTFYTQSQTAWTAMPGKLVLGISTTTHPISFDMDGCSYAFPADMDGDGDVDVVASHAQTGSVCGANWFENDGIGGGWDVHYISGDYYIKCAYPGDMDNDGDMDVVGTRPTASLSHIYWWRNDDGVGDSWTRFIIDDDYSSYFVCCADIDDDDTLEVISTPGTSPPDISWWESSVYPPDSVWDRHEVDYSIWRGKEIFPVDLDQDGDIDILSADKDQKGLKWFENTDGIGLSWSKHTIGDYSDYPVSAHAADIDGDGDYDVIDCNVDMNEVSWFENVDGSCTDWEEHVVQSDYSSVRRVYSEDLTDDGYTDIIVSMDHELFLYMNMDGSGLEWARYLICAGPHFSSSRTADFNSDGNTDILSGAVFSMEISWHEISDYSSGWLESSILDVVGYPQWDSISWTSEEPPGTDIFFQLKGSNDWKNMREWCDTIFEPSSLAGYIDSTYRYLQYRVGMTSDTAYLTPILDEVRVYWSNMGIEGGEGSVEFSVGASPNPSGGTVSFYVPPAFAGETDILVYDISGKLVKTLSGGDGSALRWDCSDSSGGEVPSGIYIVRGIFEDRSVSVRFVKL